MMFSTITLLSICAVVALGVALFLKPWQQLRKGHLSTPLFVLSIALPCLWAAPRVLQIPLHLQLSLACLSVIMLGWGLSICLLCVTSFIIYTATSADYLQVMWQFFWQGLVPASLSVLGAAWMRRTWGEHPFLYILGRGFALTIFCVFVANIAANALLTHTLTQALNTQDPAYLQFKQSFEAANTINPSRYEDGSWIALWLIAWGDGFLTGLVTSLCVAYYPHCLATWSDRLYLK